MAQLYWPRFFIASNGYARLELSYSAMISKIFGSLRKPPEADEVWAVFEEYAKNCLAVLYEHEGVWWAQFDTSQKYLPRFKTVRDEKSPTPPSGMMERHRVAYLAWKASNSLANESFRKSSADFGTFLQGRGGVGIGEGIGDGVGKKPSRAKKPREVPTKTEQAKSRHSEFKGALGEYWQAKNPGVEMPWGPAEGRNLEMWLRESPQTTVEQFKGFLRNRFRSEVNHAERPSRWISGITSYAAGPLNKFKQPMANGGSNGNGKPNRSEEIANSTLEVLARRGIVATQPDSGVRTIDARPELDAGRPRTDALALVRNL